MVAGPIVLAGHSAGGHLVARMLEPGLSARRSGRSPAARHADLARIRPAPAVAHQHECTEFQLDEDRGNCRKPHVVEASATCARHRLGWRQMNGLSFWIRHAMACRQHGAARSVVDEDKHHFDVIDALADPDSKMVQRC
jgi:arylformamidase